MSIRLCVNSHKPSMVSAARNASWYLLKEKSCSYSCPFPTIMRAHTMLDISWEGWVLQYEAGCYLFRFTLV